MNRPLAGSAAWYVRRESVVTGPFPLGVLLRYCELGRLKAPAEVSVDGVNWFALVEVPEFASCVELGTDTEGGTSISEEVDWSRERGRARRRWLEERWLPERRVSEAKAEEPARIRGTDRRIDPASRESIHFTSESRNSDRRVSTYVVAGAVILAVAAAGIAIWRYVPSESPKVILLRSISADCASTPGPGVRWMGCDKRGASLSGLDLTGAKLDNTILTGVNLSGSRLDSSDLRNADLRGADLLGASLYDVQLAGARLAQARWIDGRICPSGAVGRCASPVE
ncbi:MAG: pentapeptide repeat-containing protein [Betaproteobacteria bacterium]